MPRARVSVVVPVHNAERYLPACLESLRVQTLRDLEIIVVNDGSTDGSAAVAEDCRSRDDRIRIVDKTHGGVSSARNEGLARATGGFTAFVDADDWASPDLLETLLDEALAARADIVLCTSLREDEHGSVEKPFDLPDRVLYSPAETQSVLLRRLVGPVGPDLARPENLDSFGTVWGKLYRSSLLRDPPLRFVDLAEIGTNEDGLFNLEAFARARNTVFINRPLYHCRRDNPGSLTSVHRPRLRQQWGRMFGRIGAFITHHALPAEFREALSNRQALSLFSLAGNVLRSGAGTGFLSRYLRIRSLLKDAVLSSAVGRLSLSFLPVHWRLFYLLAKRRLTLPFYLMLRVAQALR